VHGKTFVSVKSAGNMAGGLKNEKGRKLSFPAPYSSRNRPIGGISESLWCEVLPNHGGQSTFASPDTLQP
jgi:hypothetical protein